MMGCVCFDHQESEVKESLPVPHMHTLPGCITRPPWSLSKDLCIICVFSEVSSQLIFQTGMMNNLSSKAFVMLHTKNDGCSRACPHSHLYTHLAKIGGALLWFRRTRKLRQQLQQLRGKFWKLQPLNSKSPDALNLSKALWLSAASWKKTSSYSSESAW